VDRQIAEKFSETLERARRGELDFWTDTPRGCLALIIVLDQFSQNVYRGTRTPMPRIPPLRLWLLVDSMPEWRDVFSTRTSIFPIALGHSEDMALQDRGVLYMEQMVEEAPAHRARFRSSLSDNPWAPGDHSPIWATSTAKRNPWPTSTSDEIEYIKLLLLTCAPSRESRFPNDHSSPNVKPTSMMDMGEIGDTRPVLSRCAGLIPAGHHPPMSGSKKYREATTQYQRLPRSKSRPAFAYDAAFVACASRVYQFKTPHPTTVAAVSVDTARTISSDRSYWSRPKAGLFVTIREAEVLIAFY